MNRIIISICLLLSFVVNAKQVFAETMNINDIHYLISEIEEEAAELVGGAVAIMSNDQVIYKKTFGHKKVGGSPIDDNTLFGLASVSKPIISTSLAALAEKGIVNFDDQVSIHGLNLPLKAVLSHTAGYRVRGDSDIERGVSRKTLLSLFNIDTPKSGTSYFYSNTVYAWNILPFKNQDVTSSYCLGWRKISLKKDNKSTLVFHSGRINGSTAFVGIVPDSKIGIVIMANQSSRFPLRNGLKIWKEIVQTHQ